MVLAGSSSTSRVLSQSSVSTSERFGKSESVPLKAYRAWLSVAGHEQRVAKFDNAPENLKHLIAEVKAHFQLDADDSVRFIAHDGTRRVCVNSERDFHVLATGLRNTSCPAFEIVLAKTCEDARSSQENIVSSNRQGQVERLQEENVGLKNILKRLEARMSGMELVQRNQQNELSDMARQSLLSHQDQQRREFEARDARFEKVEFAHDMLHKIVQNTGSTLQEIQNSVEGTLAKLRREMSSLESELSSGFSSVKGQCDETTAWRQNADRDIKDFTQTVTENERRLAHLESTMVSSGSFENHINEWTRARKQDQETHNILEAKQNEDHHEIKAWLISENMKTQLILQANLDESKSWLEQTTAKTVSELQEKVVVSATKLRAELLNVHESYGAAIEELDRRLTSTKAHLDTFQGAVDEVRNAQQRVSSECNLQLQTQSMHMQEGIAALTVMCNQSQLDFHKFQDNLSDSVVRLQHTCSSHDTAVSVLDADMKKTHHKFVHLRDDFYNYSNDADEWARRTTKKLKQIDNQLMPSMLEWKIQSADKKKQSLSTPQFLRSEIFDLGGVTSMKIDWYPNGLYAGGVGGATLRLYAPLGTHIRYILRIGHASMGQRIWHVQPNDAPWDEVHFPPSWVQEISQGDCIVCLEILENFSVQDGGTFGTIVRLESN